MQEHIAADETVKFDFVGRFAGSIEDAKRAAAEGRAADLANEIEMTISAINDMRSCLDERQNRLQHALNQYRRLYLTLAEEDEHRRKGRKKR